MSDTKVDMYIDGLDPSLRERFDLTGKVGVSAINAEVSPRPLDGGRFARAERLCGALDADDDRVGSVFDEDSEFFRGQLLMAWGFWNRWNKGYADVVFFSGFVDENTFVGLGGSAYHTMERGSDRLQQHSNSGIQGLMAFLNERSEAASSQPSYRYRLPACWQAEMWEADHDNPMVPDSVEFVAERLRDQPDRGVRSIIGSPMYVARTGQPTTRRVLEEYEALRNRHALQHHGKPRLEPRYGGSWEIGKPSWPQPLPLLEDDATHLDFRTFQG